MKNVFIFLICLLQVHLLIARNDPSILLNIKLDEEMGKAFLQRSVRETTTAWILFRSGIFISIAGFLIRVKNPAIKNSTTLAFCLGAGLSAGSLLPFISAMHNRQNANFLMTYGPSQPLFVEMAIIIKQHY